MSAPAIKGWCPGAHRPMMSGDGLVVRVRPFRSELSTAQALALCDLAERFGNSTLDLTSRANLQIRGVRETDHPALLEELDALGLIDADPDVEGHRNILITPDWKSDDLADRLYTGLLKNVPHLPELPEKMGFSIDCGSASVLREGSADFRFELSLTGDLLLRADGATSGRLVDENTAMAALTEMAQWFVETGGRQAGRMRRHLQNVDFPANWQTTQPRSETTNLQPGPTPSGTILGAPFGRINAVAWRDLLSNSGATAIRLMLGRLFWLRGETRDVSHPDFISSPNTLILQANACPGAPYCPQATVETRTLATQLAPLVPQGLHVSGCAKGCAHARATGLTLVGRDGRFDLVKNGCAWDAPTASGLSPESILAGDFTT